MVILHGVKNNEIYEHYFNSITEAYHYYVKHYATIGDWWYYLRCAHRLLNRVTDEEVMKSIFRNVVLNACIIQERKYGVSFY